jgi:hypothetical protein
MKKLYSGPTRQADFHNHEGSRDFPNPTHGSPVDSLHVDGSRSKGRS